MISMARPLLGEKEIEEVATVMRSGNLVQGERVSLFEREFAAFVGTDHAIAVNSGTAALHTALFAAGIGPSDEVITTPFTFISTINAILMQGARPVFADIKEETFNIDPARVGEKISGRAKAILPVDLFGYMHDVKAINSLATEHGLHIIEDACQAHGAKWRGAKAGAVALAGCFSFYATKNMLTVEGGMITTDDADLNERSRSFRNHGRSGQGKYDYSHLGFNYRMTDLAAAIGLVQLSKLENLNEARRENAARLSQGLAGIDGLTCPRQDDDYLHVFHQYTIRVTKDFGLSRDMLAGKLRERGIETAVFYPKPGHLFPYLSAYGYKAGDFPIAEKACLEVLSLPVHPLIKMEEIDMIITAIRESSEKQ